MRIHSFLIFFVTFLTAYGVGNYYIYVRLLHAIPRESWFRYLYTVIFLVFSASYIAGRFLERAAICKASDALIWIGSFWLAFFLYLLLGFLCTDIVFLMSKITGILFDNLRAHALLARQVVALFLIGVSLCIVGIGYWVARNPKITNLELTIPHKKGFSQTMQVVLVSDIHLGVIISNSRLEKLVSIVNSLNPDVVLFAGDIVDEDIEPVIEKNLGKLLRSIKSRFGIYAVTGNHEYIGGVENAVKYLQEHGIVFLRDRSILINNLFYVVGREDKTAPKFGGKHRKPIEELLKDTMPEYPAIVLDHQPNYVNKDIPQQVVAIFSGHTHNGQLWPINYIVEKIYEVPYGYRKINHVHVYVSRGYGTWGPPVRTVNWPEIVKITLQFVPYSTHVSLKSD
ncbi:MAG: metallophosphoesterase [Spirochaetes bacterium]|nr:metallophosphoesterase [Spirochaetota bacterium]